MMEIGYQFELLQPQRLWALLLLLPIIYATLSRSRDGRRGGIVAWLVCRCLLLILIVIAACEPILRGPTDQRALVLVADRSASAATNSDSSSDEFRSLTVANGSSRHVVQFAERPSALREVGNDDNNNNNGSGSCSGDDFGAMESNPAAAVLFASAMMPPDCVAQVILQTDGLQTAGRLMADTQSAGIPIDVMPTTSFAHLEVCLSRLSVINQDALDGSLRVAIEVTSNHDDEGELVLSLAAVDEHQQSADETAVRQVKRSLKVSTGTNELQLVVDDSDRQTRIVTATLVGFDDSIAENNTRNIVVPSPAPVRLLIVSDGKENALAALLRKTGYDVTERSVQQLGVASALDAFDLVVLANLSPQTVGGQRASSLKDFVKNGGGLIVVGGKRTFAASDYGGTELEALLPVTASEGIAAARKNLAMLLVVDKSKSMLEDNRMELAKEAAKQVIGLQQLTAQDLAGILAFGDDSQWVSPIVECKDKAALKRQIDGLKAEGRTDMFPALQRGFLALTEAPADRRHMILMTDGVPSPGDFGKIARQIADAGITVSTVSVGSGADQTILKDISRISGGRHIHCESPKELASRLVEEAKAAAESAGDVYEATVFRQLPGLDISSAPSLSQFQITNPRQHPAQLLLQVDARDPLLAWWRYSRGIAVAITADVAGSDANAWSNWDGLARFWQTSVGLARRKSGPANFRFSGRRRANTYRLVLDVLQADGGYLNDAQPELVVANVKTTLHDFESAPVSISPIRLTAPGRYEAEVKLPGKGAYLATMQWKDEQATVQRANCSLAVDYPDELILQPTDETFLRNVAAVSGGHYGRSMDSVVADAGRKVARIWSLWQGLVFASLLLFVVDTVLRRILTAGLPVTK